MPKRSDLDFEEAISDSFAKDLDYLELPLSRKAFLLVSVLFFSVSLIIILKLLFFNAVKADFYKERAFMNVHKENLIPAYRGVITDRFGEVLVENASSFSIFLNVADFLKENSELDANLKLLSGILEIEEKEIHEKIENFDLEKKSLVLLSRNVNPSQVISLKSANLPGVTVQDDFVRRYKDGPVFAHILGYDGAVKVGLEAVYDEYLSGQDGVSLIFKDARGNVLDKKILREPVSGNSLQTTIDADLQRFFYNRLSSGLRSLGVNSGVGIAMNPQNGELLALVSLPSFDNNLFVSGGFSEEKRRLLNSFSKPLFNRAVSGVYNPGSTIKPLVALAALRENLISPQAQVFSRGYVEIPNPYAPEKPSRFVDWKPHGWVDLRSALARSSNIYFYFIGGGLPRSEFELVRGTEKIEGLGIKKLHKYWRDFLLDKKTGVDLPAESFGFLPDPEEKEKRTGQIWRIGDTYNVSIGQGDLLVTPLELLNFIASIANGGRIYQPHFVNNGPIKISSDYSDWQKEIEEVRLGLRDAVAKWYGTANLLSSLPMASSGKTGSAQIENNTKTNAFFMGYAPAADENSEENPDTKPQIAILVLIENAREGSLNAVPVARDVLEWYYYNRLAKSL